MKLSEIDQALIRYADTLSPQAISFKIEGVLSPEQVMSRIAQLADTADWLTAAQQDQIVTMKMRQIIVELEEMPRNTRNAEVIINALDRLGNRLDKRMETTEKDLSTLYAFQGRAMLDAMEKALAFMRGRLTGSDKLSQKEWDDALESAMHFAQMELSRHDPELTPGTAPEEVPTEPILVPSERVA